MTRKEAERQAHMFRALGIVGISETDADRLRRISITLHRWHELECNGDVERDELTLSTYRIHQGYRDTSRWPTPDRETGALNRLAALMWKYPGLKSYVQGDPRGCALYILKPGDVPDGKDIDSYYSRGIAVY